ncbi:hypothetical protein I4U23_001556 [Adineta vaga]|nr:hypothetical protein I4U23_001556 [Adineta vaga]
MSAQKQCVTCDKNSGILTCNGCRQVFCGKHVLEHRQNLTNELEDIIQDHDSLQEELQQSIDEHVLIERINQWEKISLTTIRTVAETIRQQLQQMIDKSNKQLSKSCVDIANNIRSSRDADDFCENDLTQWIQQLNKLKQELVRQSSVQIIEDEQSVIRLIKIYQNESSDKIIIPYQNRSLLLHSPTIQFAQERFSKVIGPGKIIDDGLLAKCTSTDLDYAFILGEQLYFHGEQTIRLKVGQAKFPYNIFFGCISSQITDTNTKIHYYSPFTVGWFGCNEIYQHGTVNYNSKVHGYKSDEILSNDVIQVTFDCERKQMELFHERTNKHHSLSVNTDEAPLPWKLLLVLNRQNDYATQINMNCKGKSMSMKINVYFC